LRLLTKLAFAVALLAGGMAFGQATPTAAVDPCFGNTQKSSAFLNLTTATTSTIVGLTANTAIYVCSYVIVMSGTTAADTVAFVVGTGVNCVTSPTTISATFNSGILTQGATTIASSSGAGQALVATLNRALCVTSTVGTSPNINVQITYVQQ
jgi:hypothetical protein